MNNETNRLAQIIANAADKELGTRSTDGQPRRQDKAAALVIEAEYLFIRRSELPEVRIVEYSNAQVAEVTSPMGVWSCPGHAESARLGALEYLAAAEAIKAWQDKAGERELQRRRDELAREITEKAYGAEACITDYHNASNPVQVAIDRIIELERNAA